MDHGRRAFLSGPWGKSVDGYVALCMTGANHLRVPRWPSRAASLSVELGAVIPRAVENRRHRVLLLGTETDISNLSVLTHPSNFRWTKAISARRSKSTMAPHNDWQLCARSGDQRATTQTSRLGRERTGGFQFCRAAYSGHSTVAGRDCLKGQLYSSRLTNDLENFAAILMTTKPLKLLTHKPEVDSFGE